MSYFSSHYSGGQHIPTAISSHIKFLTLSNLKLLCKLKFCTNKIIKINTAKKKKNKKIERPLCWKRLC